MRTYGQFCGIAKALDLVGDRWTLLIVRELLALGPCRHTDLRNGLPGVASNLLVERLRALEEAGLIRREAAPPPVATTLFHLTERGQALEPILRELGRWGAPLLREPAANDNFRTNWLAVHARALVDLHPDRPAVAIQLRPDGHEDMVIEVKDGTVHTHMGRVDDPTASLTGPPALLATVLAGELDLKTARRQGLHLEGDVGALRRVLPGGPFEGGETT